MQMQREWTPQEGKIACLSIQQPFCQAILLGKKTIELREWQTHYRGLIALHAGKSWYGGIKDLRKATERERAPLRRFAERHGLSLRIDDYPLGAIVGVAKLVRCTTFSKNGWEKLREQHCSDRDWSSSYVGWQFADVQALSEPIPCRGYLGLFAVDEAAILERLKQEVE